MSERGIVYLVGAGPGDPGLITVAGRDALAAADCVVYDKLIDPRLLEYAPPAAERIYVGKEGGSSHCTPQSEINALLVEKGSAGLRVVRLKGGDPLLFARGAEEAEALVAAGVPFAIIPGVTAALAVAATAAIPLTHRAAASAVAFVTGHEDPAKSDLLNWPALARFPGTLVVYMALTRRRAIAAALVAHGKDPATPVAFVERGGDNRQQVVETTLAETVQPTGGEDPAAALRSPVLAVIGAVCTSRPRLKWFERRPLFGKKILILRPPRQAAELQHKLEALGAQVVSQPAFTIEPPEDWADVDRSIEKLADYRWVVFTSRNGVELFLERVWSLGRDARAFANCRIAAIGPGTAAALEEWRLRADLVPSQYRAEELAAELAPRAAGGDVLLVRANRGRQVLGDVLKAAGARVETVVAYRQIDVLAPPFHVLEGLRNGGIEWVLFSSSGMATAFFGWLDPELKEIVAARVALAAISPVTSTCVRAAGFTVRAEASVFTLDGLVDAVRAAVTSFSS